MGNELFAIDGCKMSSDAAKEWSGTFKGLGEKRDKLKRLIRHHLHEHHERDEAETEAEQPKDGPVQGQWQLYCLAHNIEKLANYGQLAA